MRNILFKYKYFIIAILFVIILAVFFHSYQNTRGMLQENNTIQRSMVEQNIVEALSYADNSYKIMERHLKQDMKKYSEILVEKYRQNPDIYSWDLEKLKEQLGNYEMYIVDENLEIVRTTYKEDLGMDFKQFPNFAELLRKRMAGDTFEADRMDISTNAQRLKKYSYMPTPDHKYLIELSIDILKTHPSMKNLNVFSHADDLTKKYDLVEKISFYKFNETGSEVGIVTRGEGPYIDTGISEEVKEVVKNAVLNNKSIEVNSQENNRTDKYIPYLNYAGNGLNWWNSYVVGITYDNSILKSKLAAERNLFIGKTAIITLVFVLFTFTMVYLLRRTEQAASCDALTSLPNRKRFGDYFNKLTAQEKAVDKLALLFIDLDNFKAINDTYGHETGDQVLKTVAEKLAYNLRKEDMVIRAGGDEFMVLLTGVTYRADAEAAVKKIMETLKTSIQVEGSTIEIGASIGVSIYPDNGTNLEELTHKADEAMYKAKKQKPEMLKYTFAYNSSPFCGLELFAFKKGWIRVMFLLAHTGITVAAAVGLERVKKSKLQGLIDYRFILLGSLLPDIIDKPLGGILLLETIGNGRIYCHTLCFLVLLFASGVVIKRKWGSSGGLALAGGVLGHHILDGIWRIPETFFWPLYGWSFPPGTPQHWLDMWLSTLLNDPLVFVPEILGGTFLLLFLTAVKRSGIKKFILTGRF